MHLYVGTIGRERDRIDPVGMTSLPRVGANFPLVIQLGCVGAMHLGLRHGSRSNASEVVCWHSLHMMSPIHGRFTPVSDKGRDAF